jgi:hypothetical protein
MKNKEDITRAIAGILNIDQSHPKISLDDLMFKWWATGRTGTGLRLTEDGMRAFTDADIEFYDFPLFNNDLKNYKKEEFKAFTLKLGKKIDCPFYIGLKNSMAKSAYIRIYDSKIATMITLYGDFLDYINASRL